MNIRRLYSWVVVLGIVAAGSYPLVVKAEVPNCLGVEDAIGTAAQKIDLVEQDYIKKYTATADQLQHTGNDLALQGSDVTQFEADRKVFLQKISDFKGSYDTFSTAAQSARTMACNGSASDLQSSLDQARTQLTVVRGKAADVYKEYQTVLVSDLKTF